MNFGCPKPTIKNVKALQKKLHPWFHNGTPNLFFIGWPLTASICWHGRWLLALRQLLFALTQSNKSLQWYHCDNQLVM